ncbi:MAG: hypothetical protein H6807_00900 [Planctomycetes bacterium]|nr:hypothetical protein [Planctomycetota bacterium]
MAEAPEALVEAALAEIRSIPSAGVAPLVAAIRERHGDTVVAIAFYGSILRGLDPRNGILDLMVVVDDYRRAYRSRFKAWANALLPPNVFYLECGDAEARLRCKYTLIRADQLAGYVAPGCAQVYFWGRFAQPAALAFSRDEAAARLMAQLFARAQLTFLEKVLPLLSPTTSADEIWTRGLDASYGAELRAERGGVGTRLVQAAAERYRRVTALAAPALGLEPEGDDRYRNPMSAPEVGRRRWRWRGRQGKLMNLLRLIKAVFTFEGGVDYALWKIERHSGVTVTVSDRARRHPLIFGWGPLFRLWRRGAFR